MAKIKFAMLHCHEIILSLLSHALIWIMSSYHLGLTHVTNCIIIAINNVCFVIISSQTLNRFLPLFYIISSEHIYSFSIRLKQFFLGTINPGFSSKLWPYLSPQHFYHVGKYYFQFTDVQTEVQGTPSPESIMSICNSRRLTTQRLYCSLNVYNLLEALRC